MREIKFRVWDRLCKRYWYKGFSISWDGNVQNLSKEIQEARLKAGWTIEKSYTDECKFDLEQFVTKDKNGKDVFEGDEIKALVFNPLCRITGKVGWRDETLNWVLYHTPNTPECVGLWELQDIELIEEKDNG